MSWIQPQLTKQNLNGREILACERIDHRLYNFIMSKGVPSIIAANDEATGNPMAVGTYENESERQHQIGMMNDACDFFEKNKKWPDES